MEMITLQVAEDTSSIIFHVNRIDINKETVTVKKTDNSNSSGEFTYLWRPFQTNECVWNVAEVIPIKSQDYIDGERYRIELGDTLKKGEVYVLTLEFQGELNNQLQGFYKSHYTVSNDNVRFAVSTQFSPTDARRAFPCFDDPAFKAKFKIRLARPANMSSLSNMPLRKSELFQ